MPSKQGPRLQWRLSNQEHPNADLEKTVQAHLLNHAVQVLLPVDTTNGGLQQDLDVQLVAMLQPHEGYQVIRASLADILAQVLNTAVILQEDASVQAISLADRLESNHAVAITPDGTLHLAVSSEIYSRLGLVGVHSPSNKDRYNVSVDLKAKSMQPGQDRYAQVLAKLRACFPPQAFLARVEVAGQLRALGLPAEALSPAYGTEVMMPLECQSRTQAGLMLPPLSRATFEQLMLPEAPEAGAAAATTAAGAVGSGTGVRTAQGVVGINVAEVGAGADLAGGPASVAAQQQQQPSPQWQQHQDWQLRRAISGLHTWLGALACGQGAAACNDLLPDEVMPRRWEDAPEAMQEEEERRLTGSVTSRTWRGMLSHQQIGGILSATSQLLAARNVPWAIVNVWGFADTPVAWAGLEHGAAWGGAGESCYSVLLLQGGDYCVFRSLGANEMTV